MNTFENSANKPSNNSRTDLSESERMMIRDVRNFFLTDSCAEIVGSMNAMVESFLFSTDLENVTPVMKGDIVNHLRVVTLLSKLNENYDRVRA